MWCTLSTKSRLYASSDTVKGRLTGHAVSIMHPAAQISQYIWMKRSFLEHPQDVEKNILINYMPMLNKGTTNALPMTLEDTKTNTQITTVRRHMCFCLSPQLPAVKHTKITSTQSGSHEISLARWWKKALGRVTESPIQYLNGRCLIQIQVQLSFIWSVRFTYTRVCSMNAACRRLLIFSIQASTILRK